MKLLYLGISLILFSFILFTQSRGPLLACGITIFACPLIKGFFYKEKEGNHSHRNNFLPFLLIILAAIAAMFILYPDFFKTHIFSRTSYRPEIYWQGILQASNAPFFGHGLTADTRHPKAIWIIFWFPIALVAASNLPGNSLSSPE